MIILFAIALISALFHNLTEIKTLREQLEAAGKTFSLREHVKRNIIAWTATLCPIVILSLSHSHLIKQFPSLENWMFAVYAAVGWGGSDFAITIFSSSQKRLTEVITKAINDTPSQ